MSLQLLHAVIHKLEKDAGAPGRIVEARSCLDVADEPLQALVTQVQQVYTGRASKSYGAFDPTLKAVSAELYIERLRDDPTADFHALSLDLMLVLKDKAESQNFSTGGHVLMFDANSMGSRWFGVVILNSTAGTMINEELRVISAPHLDVEGIRFAGRVNVSEWEAGNDRYISFLRGKKNEVSVYFQRFLGCSTTQQDLNDTRNLVKAVKKFALDAKLDPKAREQLLRQVDRIAGEKAKNQEPLDLSALANEVWPSDPDALKKTFAEADPPISDGFIPHKRGLDGLTRFTAKAANWKLEFDREVITDQTFEFIEEDQSLTIHNLPADIVASLAKEFAKAEQPDSESAAEPNVAPQAEEIPAE